jgi:alpha-maltose-1-phosphate synthase
VTVRLIGLTQGPVGDPLASSGLNQNVFAALARQSELVGVLDNSLHGWQRGWNALASFRPQRDLWRERFDLNLWSFKQLSRQAGELLAAQRNFQAVFQLRVLYTPGVLPAPWPYFLFIDNTYALSMRYYPPWAPMGASESHGWLELERQAYRQALAVFCRTEWVRRSLLEDYGTPPERAVYTGTGCHFGPDSLPDGKQIDDGRTILFVGKELRRKGVPQLLQAFEIVRRQLPDARLQIVGRELEVQQPGVEVLGKITDRDRLRQLYAAASLFVLPALFEPSPNVVTEAMSYHLPCIVSDGGGVADLVLDGESGYIVPTGQVEPLAERILELLRDPEKRRRMGERGAQRTRAELNWDRVVERMVPYLEQAA